MKARHQLSFRRTLPPNAWRQIPATEGNRQLPWPEGIGELPITDGHSLGSEGIRKLPITEGG